CGGHSHAKWSGNGHWRRNGSSNSHFHRRQRYVCYHLCDCYCGITMILTEIGEVGVHLGDETYVLRPSLYSMSLLGEPRWIVKDYVKLMSNPINRSDRWQQFLTALRVVHSCSEKDIGHVFGYLNDK